jgi:hippurate hydrolase
VTRVTRVPAVVAAYFSESLANDLVTLRREIHADPELAFEERRTAARLVAALERLGVREIRRVGETGIVARIPGMNRTAPIVAVRGDIDALPIREATGLTFASRNDGVMHACGHDVHATWTVGAAALLAAQPAAGDVLIVLQPAEEVGRGASAILESGLLDEVRAIFGGHVDRRFEVGEIVADEGPLAASADIFTVELIGGGAHAARPHESRDPIVAAAAVISALQSIVSRRLNPATPGVVTVGSIHAGTAANIIPDRVTLTGTIRAIEPVSRTLMCEEVRKVTAGVASGFGVEARVAFTDGTPPVVNSAVPTAWAQKAVVSTSEDISLKPLGFLNLAAEDFGFYLEKIPGCFMRVGARELGGEVVPAHSPNFVAAEESVFIGAAVLAECARVASRALSEH